MTDNEIIRALEEMVEYPHYYEEGQILKNVLDLINRQQAEIERLKIENQSLRMAANSYKIHYNEAVKEFAEKLKFVWFDNRYDSPDIDFDYFVDILVETLVGDTE